jgi:hypothetical protein
MKKYLLCTLLCFSIAGSPLAQDSLRVTFAKLLTPYLFLNEVAINAKILLFERQWVKGKLLTANNTVVTNDSFLFNFDKMDRRLLVTKDFNKVFEIDWREFKAILFYIHDTGLVFKHIYPLSNKDLFQVLINGSDRYSLYKTMHMKIVKETGSSFGSFARGPEKLVDLPEYCIMFPNHEYRIIHSKKRAAIERIFSLDPDYAKVNDFLNAMGKAEYDENDLRNLIQYLNKASL